MLPPQAMHAIGLTLARLIGHGAAYFFNRAVDGDLPRLLKLPEPVLLGEIAERELASRAPDKMPSHINRDDLVQYTQTIVKGWHPDELVQFGQTVVDRWRPKIRALICPHRDGLVKALGSSEYKLTAAVAGYLVGDLPGLLVEHLATLVVRHGLPTLCGPAEPDAAAVLLPTN